MSETELPPASPRTTFEEAALGRVHQMPGGMRAVAQRAVDAGLIDPGFFGVNPAGITEQRPNLEMVGSAVGLEAIILRTGRPPLLVRNDAIVIDPIAEIALAPDTDLKALDAAAIARMNRFLPSIGRVEFLNHQMQWGGTGWVIEEKGDRRWVVTNRHVAKLVARRKWDGSGVFLRSVAGPLYGMKLDTREEVGAPQNGERECPVERIVYLADDSEADCALLEISVTAMCQPAPLPLAEHRAKVGETIGVVGYPAYDDRNEQSAMRHYFGDLFNVKRFSPGLVTQSGSGLLLMHDCTTLGGNSGSCLLSVDQDAVVGLHFSGSFGVANSAVSVETLRQLQTGRLFVVNAPSEAHVAPESEAADGSHPADHFAGRAGYEPAFLDNAPPVPIPDLDAVIGDLATPSDEHPDKPRELRYTHFGVYYSRSRRTPLFTAVNIDGERAKRIKRVSPDIWFFDERIDRSLQLGKHYYVGDLDRGHMVRREDPNWGENAQLANDDTFHYTNAALQHALLNRAKTQWQGLENYILDSSRTMGFRACVFTGPVLTDNDPALGIENVQIPMEFWKVVVMPRTDGGLHATGYLLSQGDMIRSLLEQRKTESSANESANEGFQLGEFRTFQVAIKHIEQATGLRWPALDGADPLAAHGNEAVSAVTYMPLESLEDIVT